LARAAADAAALEIHTPGAKREARELAAIASLNEKEALSQVVIYLSGVY